MKRWMFAAVIAVAIAGVVVNAADDLSAARDLYASAAYEEALAILDQLPMRLEMVEALTIVLAAGLTRGPDGQFHMVWTWGWRGQSISYAHPVYTTAGVAAQARWGEISGARHTRYCGAYWGWGFHEDGVVSGLRAVEGM